MGSRHEPRLTYQVASQKQMDLFWLEQNLCLFRRQRLALGHPSQAFQVDAADGLRASGAVDAADGLRASEVDDWHNIRRQDRKFSLGLCADRQGVCQGHGRATTSAHGVCPGWQGVCDGHWRASARAHGAPSGWQGRGCGGRSGHPGQSAAARRRWGCGEEWRRRTPGTREGTASHRLMRGREAVGAQGVRKSTRASRGADEAARASSRVGKAARAPQGVWETTRAARRAGELAGEAGDAGRRLCGGDWDAAPAVEASSATINQPLTGDGGATVTGPADQPLAHDGSTSMAGSTVN